MNLQTHYQEAIKFATSRHLQKDQKVKGTDLPYVVHLSNVAMEVFMAALNSGPFDLDYAVQVALLHDTIEDTDTSYEEIEERFGHEIAEGVMALTKDETLPKEEQTRENVTRIVKMRREVWLVKLADRITNLQPPPADWTALKIANYREESRIILEGLRDGNPYLAGRLETVIGNYR